MVMNYVAPLVTLAVQWVRPNGMLRTPYKSGGDLLRAALHDVATGTRPKALYLDGSAISQPAAEAKDEDKQRRLWEGSISLAGVSEEETVLKSLR
jgi:hypothetical protein